MPSFPADVVAQNREGLIPNSTKSFIGLNSAMRNRAVTVFSHVAVSCTASELLLMHSYLGNLQNWGKEGVDNHMKINPRISLNTNLVN